jgi:hypothetical protein
MNRSCINGVKSIMLFLYFIFAALFLMLSMVRNSELELQLAESVTENARILSTGRRFEQELKERNGNTQLLPALHAATHGVNTSFQLKNARANAPPKLYLAYTGPFGFVRAPLADARVVV